MLGRHAEAEPLLVESYTALSARRAPAAQRQRIVDHLIRLYEALGRSEQVDQWGAWSLDLVSPPDPFAR